MSSLSPTLDNGGWVPQLRSNAGERSGSGHFENGARLLARWVLPPRKLLAVILRVPRVESRLFPALVFNSREAFVRMIPIYGGEDRR
jgi:hypothetical protein